MGSAAKNMRAGGSRKIGKPRKRSVKSPLDRAAGWELVWSQVAPVFEAGRCFTNPSFVYFVGEEGKGPIKIGSAKDPVLRLRGLQCGNPRRLCVEYVLLGDGGTERMLHEIWEPFAIRSHRGQKVDAPPGTEWFKAEIRETLEPILKTASEKQVSQAETDEGDSYLSEMEFHVRQAHLDHDKPLVAREQMRFLGATVGYHVPRPSRLSKTL